VIRARRILWAARLLKLAAWVYPGDISRIHTDIDEAMAAARAGLRDLEASR
jgi:hypothetical protein